MTKIYTSLWQVHGKSYKVDVRLVFILAARIAFWVEEEEEEEKKNRLIANTHCSLYD